MGVFNFTGHLQGIQPAQLDFISEVLEKQGFRGPEASLTPVGAVGDNYMSKVVRVTVTENGKTFKMIVKMALEGKMMRQMMQIGLLYRNECIIYTELLPKFVELQKSVGVKQLYRAPECYGCLEAEPNEVILLEDLKESGFQMLDRFKPLSNTAVKLTLRNFAIFHSLSFVLKRQEPETFRAISSKFGDMMDSPMATSEEGRAWRRQMEESVLSVLVEERHKKHVRGRIGNVFSALEEVKKGDKGSEYTVIQQGDGWSNNIMFRIQDNVPVECVLIDYQMAIERSPAYDILYFVFNSTSYEQRQQHYFEYLDYYHSQLDLSLRNYGLEAGDVYPREQLDKDLKRFGSYMLSTNIMISRTILKQADEARKTTDLLSAQTKEEMSERMEGLMEMGAQTRELFKTRCEGLIDSFVEYGYL